MEILISIMLSIFASIIFQRIYLEKYLKKLNELDRAFLEEVSQLIIEVLNKKN